MKLQGSFTYKVFLTVALTACLAVQGMAQTAEWSIPSSILTRFEEFSDGLAAILEGKSYGYINLNGDRVIPPQYYSVNDFSEGLAAVVLTEDGKWGYVDKTGKMVIQPQFDEARKFSDGMAAVSQGGKWGYVDKTGKIAIKPQFEMDVLDFNNGFAAVLLGNETPAKWGFIDKTGKKTGVKVNAFGMEKTEPLRYSEGLAASSIMVQVAGQDGPSDKWGFIDTKGTVVIKHQFDEAHGAIFSGGMAIVRQKEKNCFIDKTGKIIATPAFSGNIVSCSDGMVLIEQDGKFGFMDKTGKVVIAPQFEGAKDFSEGLAAVSKDGKWGFIDKTGQLVIEHLYVLRVPNPENPEYWPVADLSGKFKDGIVAIFTTDGESFWYSYLTNPLKK
jgi:WG containing repeat